MPPETKAPSGAAPPAAAGVVLRQMHRRVRWVRLGVWAALAAGPAALTLWALTPPTAVEALAPSAPARAPAPRAVHDPRGYAEVFTAAWLRSDGDTPEAAQSRLAQSMAPSVPLPEPTAQAQSAQSVSAVRSAQRGGGRWVVTVAAQYADGTVRYFSVPVTVGEGGASFAVERAPGQLAAPAAADVPETGYRVELSGEGELALTVAEFLTAYLAGDGQVARYLAPGVRLRAVTPAPYTAVEIEQARADSEKAMAEAVPGDGTRVRVLVQVTAKDAAGRWPLAYELTLAARAGRWEVAALESGAAAQEGRS
ncbi:conjugal transfer protein [Streptomyces monticola]|uniref:Conjugal transfer protein n=1 Tax=Streptomyces monticola TaxID=2666263 RepID=A0ABW2JT85_9ACTN